MTISGGGDNLQTDGTSSLRKIRMVCTDDKQPQLNLSTMALAMVVGRTKIIILAKKDHKLSNIYPPDWLVASFRPSLSFSDYIGAPYNSSSNACRTALYLDNQMNDTIVLQYTTAITKFWHSFPPHRLEVSFLVLNGPREVQSCLDRVAESARNPQSAVILLKSPIESLLSLVIEDHCPW